jgi:general secretion pathway protein A
MVRTTTAEPLGFRQASFSLAPDPRLFFRSRTHGAAFDLLRSTIRRGEGLVVLTGDIGAGKTTVCRALLEDLDGRTFIAFAPNAFVSESELLGLMLQEFGVVPGDAAARQRLEARPAHELVDVLAAFLHSLVPLGAHAVIVIDEAQHLSPEALERIRILSNLDTGRRQLLQVVLVGQRTLEDRLRSADTRTLDQRVSGRARLDPLTCAETAAYVAHRLQVGGDGEAVRFSEGALRRVHRRSGGNPRLVNLLCGGAVAAARAAGVSLIPSRLVSEAAAALDVRRPEPAWVARVRHVAATVAAGVAASVLLGSAAAGLTTMRVRGDRSVTAAVAAVQNREAGAGDVAGVAGAGGNRIAILAASFPDVTQASLARRRLVRLGYDAYQVLVDTRTPRVQVWVGDYADEAEAQLDERRLRRTPGFDTARLVRYRP